MDCPHFSAFCTSVTWSMNQNWQNHAAYTDFYVRTSFPIVSIIVFFPVIYKLDRPRSVKERKRLQFIGISLNLQCVPYLTRKRQGFVHRAQFPIFQYSLLLTQGSYNNNQTWCSCKIWHEIETAKLTRGEMFCTANGSNLNFSLYSIQRYIIVFCYSSWNTLQY